MELFLGSDEMTLLTDIQSHAVLPKCSLARLLCQMNLTGGWAGQQVLFHLLLKLEHLRSHSVDLKFVLSDSNHIELELLQVSLDV